MLKKFIFFSLFSLVLSACGGGGASSTSLKEKALEKITAYAENGSAPEPLLQDYINAGITGITNENIGDINLLVESHNAEDVDTTEELYDLVVQLGVNVEPIAQNISVTMSEDNVVDVTLLATDANQDALNYIQVSDPTHGTLSINGSTATYTPAVNYNGTDSFSFKANDGTLDSNIAIVSISVFNLPDQPQNVQALSGNNQVTLVWDDVSDATSFDICQATETISNPENCAVHQDGILITDTSSPKVITGLTNDMQYFYVIIPKNINGDGPASDVVNTTPAGIVVASPSGLLNDTGITDCGDYAYGASGNHSNTESCTNTQDSEGDSIPVGQDGHLGRDFSQNDDSNGHAGFSFTKISSNGQALPVSASSWSCVKDNVTGLIWEVKTISGLHKKSDRYTWYNTDNNTNGGAVGSTDAAGYGNGNFSCTGANTNETSTYCNTQAFISRVNTETYCGASDWRLPTREELRSITDRSTINPAIDSSYFPNTSIFAAYWSSSPYIFSGNGASGAWAIRFTTGYDSTGNKDNHIHVRLVRGGQ